MIYYAFTRSTFAFAAFLCIFPIFFTKNTFVKELLTRPFFLMGGSLCLIAALITPIMIEMNINSTPDGNFLTVYGSTYMGMGNVVFVFSSALILYLLV